MFFLLQSSFFSLSIALPNGSSSGSSGSDAGDASGKLEGQQCSARIDARKSPKVGQCTRDTHGNPSLNASNAVTSSALVPSSTAYCSTSDTVLLSSQDSQSIGTVEGLRCQLGSQHVPIKHASSDSNDSKTPSGNLYNTVEVCHSFPFFCLLFFSFKSECPGNYMQKKVASLSFLWNAKLDKIA